MIIQKIPWQNPVKVMGAFKNLPYSIFLDSSLNNRLGRFSIIAANPFSVLKSKDQQTQLIQNGKVRFIYRNPFAVLQSLFNLYKLPICDQALPFYGGAIGYFGYDLLHGLEKIPRNRIDDLNIPDCVIGFYDSCLIFDNFTKKIYAVSTGLPEKSTIKEKQSLRNLVKLISCLKENKPSPQNNNRDLKLASNFTKNEYIKAILEAKHLIKEGEIYQVNLSQRFETEFKDDPWGLYLRLRSISPNPFGGFLNFGNFQLLCSSPERFLRVKDDIVETRPMKGTRPRGETETKDQKFKTELLKSKKDSAELLMITDLLRNDLGKVCEYGSVRVKRLKNLEKYTSVFQTTALIQGRLHQAKDRIDLLKACFPGGSITGAPKVRSMQVIAELEPTCRGPYTGALGYLDFCGNMDLNIIIRSILIKNSKAYFQVGGGIVADSDPEKEYQETLIKAKAMVEALKNGR